MIDRSSFLSLTLGGLAAILDATSGSAQTPGAVRRKIDIHHHIVPPQWLAAFSARGRSNDVLGNSPHVAQWTPTASLEQMDIFGIQTAFTSLSTPGIWWGDVAAARALARECNEYAARNALDHPGRFGFFAAVPLPDVDGSLSEATYAFDTLKADGVGLMSSHDLHWHGDVIFRPVFDELNRRSAVVYTHPIDSPCCQDIQPGVGPPTIEYNTDTARTIYSLIQGDPAAMAAARYSNIKFIFSHGGGTMPSLIERFLGGPDTINDTLAAPAAPNSRLYHLRRFYYDTAQSPNVVQMQGLKTIVGIGQIVFGSDYPFGAGMGKHLIGLQKAGFTADELRLVHRENALKIIPRLKA
jgi:predicted TIM-barrel fold metal-dependent hydrolase